MLNECRIPDSHALTAKKLNQFKTRERVSRSLVCAPVSAVRLEVD